MIKLLLVLLLAVSAHADFNWDSPQSIYGPLNPTVVPVNAPPAWIYQSTGTLTAYIKLDTGSTTNWSPLAGGGGGGSMTVGLPVLGGSPNSVLFESAASNLDVGHFQFDSTTGYASVGSGLKIGLSSDAEINYFLGSGLSVKHNTTGAAMTLYDDGTASFVDTSGLGLTFDGSGKGTIYHPLTQTVGPSVATDTTNKAYVDALLLANVQYKTNVQAAATAAYPPGYAYTDALAGGPGDTIVGAPAMVVDGYAVLSGDRVLFSRSGVGFTAKNFGIFTCIIAGPMTCTRSTDADDGTQIVAAQTNVVNGVANAGRSFYMNTPGPITINGTSMNWIDVSVGAVSAGNGLQLSGGVMSVRPDPASNTIAAGAAGTQVAPLSIKDAQVSATAAIALTKIAATFSTGLTNTTGTITNNLSTGVSGGQSVVGSTVASQNLTLSSTTSATKGKVISDSPFTFATGLGATTQLYGPTDQTFVIGSSAPTAPADGRQLYIASAGGNGYGAGGPLTITTGPGGTSGASTPGKNGGAFNQGTGAGASVSAATSTGGAGGAFNGGTGGGGQSTGITAATGGAGGTITVPAGAGGNAVGTGVNVGGTGGSQLIYGGNGGQAFSGTSNTGGNAGLIRISTGVPGTGSTANGSPGLIQLQNANVDILDIYQTSVAATPGSVLGALTTSGLTLAQTWNTTGLIDGAFRMNIIDTASNAASLLMDLKVGGASKFAVNKTGITSAVHFEPSPSGPSLFAGAGAGTGPIISSIGTDQSFILSVLTGTAPSVSSAIATMTYAVPFLTAPHCIVSPSNSATAALAVGATAYIATTDMTTSTVIVTSNATALTAGVQYRWVVMCL